jgi:hypothetical protein
VINRSITTEASDDNNSVVVAGVSLAAWLGYALGVTTTANGYRLIPPSNEVGVVPPPSLRQLSRHSLRPIASGLRVPSQKHDQPARILLDAGSVDRSGGLESVCRSRISSMPVLSPPGSKSSIEYFAMSVGIGRTLMAPRLRHPANFRIDPKIIQLSVWQSLPPAGAQSAGTTSLYASSSSLRGSQKSARRSDSARSSTVHGGKRWGRWSITATDWPGHFESSVGRVLGTERLIVKAQGAAL